MSRCAVGAGSRSSAPTGLQPPAALGGEVGDDRLDDRQQRGQLGGRAVEVVGGQQPQGDHLDADVLAPAEQRQDVVGAGLVALLGVGAVGPGPAPVAVEHDADVAREAAGREAGGEPSLVGAVQQVPQPHRQPPRHERSRPPYSRAGRLAGPTPRRPHPPRRTRRPHRLRTDVSGAARRPPHPRVGARAGPLPTRAGSPALGPLTYGPVVILAGMSGTAPTADRGPSRPPSPPSSPGCAAGSTPGPSRWRSPPASSWSRSRRRTKARVGAAVFAVTAALLFGTSARLPPGHVVAAARRAAQAAGPLQHLPDHRRHLHAVRAAAAARGTVPLAAARSPGPAPSAACCSGSSGSARRAGSTPRSTSRSAGSPCSTSSRCYHAGGAAVVALIAVGGLLYTLGAVVYGTKRPNPSPRWFGFHEVFHVFTVAAFVAHYVAASHGGLRLRRRLSLRPAEWPRRRPRRR